MKMDHGKKMRPKIRSSLLFLALFSTFNSAYNTDFFDLLRSSVTSKMIILYTTILKRRSRLLFTKFTI